jgi:hypothetical protein
VPVPDPDDVDSWTFLIILPAGIFRASQPDPRRHVSRFTFAGLTLFSNPGNVDIGQLAKRAANALRGQWDDQIERTAPPNFFVVAQGGHDLWGDAQYRLLLDP